MCILNVIKLSCVICQLYVFTFFFLSPKSGTFFFSAANLFQFFSVCNTGLVAGKGEAEGA